MTANEIRSMRWADLNQLPAFQVIFLQEIAAQLAELNELQAEGQKLGNEVARRSLAMMEKTEQELRD
jgi:hypothetical protein